MELAFLEIRDSDFLTGVPQSLIQILKRQRKADVQSHYVFFMNKNVLHDMIFLKQHLSFFYPQNTDIYLQHINILIQNLIMKPIIFIFYSLCVLINYDVLLDLDKVYPFCW